MTTARTRGITALVVTAALLLGAATAALLIGGVVLTDGRGELAPGRAQNDLGLAWISRGILMLAALWILIGIIATRTTLVRRPGAAAARATWLSATRPWRARESMLGLLPLDRALMVAVPLALLIATNAIQSTFIFAEPSALIVVSWIIFTVVAIVLVRPRSPWPIIATVGGILVLRSLVDLIGLSIAGPGGMWVAMWDNTLIRVAVYTVTFGLTAWLLIAVGGAANQQVGARRATGVVLGAAGATVAVAAAVVMLRMVTDFSAAWDDDVIERAIPSAFAPLFVAVGVIACVTGIWLARSRTTDNASS